MSSDGNSGKQRDAKRVLGRPFTKGDPRVNRGGRPKGFAQAIRRVVGEDPEDLAKIALSIARGELRIDTVQPIKLKVGETETIVDHPLVEVPSHGARLSALEFLRDTGWGKPKQSLELETPSGSALQVMVVMPPEEE